EAIAQMLKRACILDRQYIRADEAEAAVIETGWPVINNCGRLEPMTPGIVPCPGPLGGPELLRCDHGSTCSRGDNAGRQGEPPCLALSLANRLGGHAVPPGRLLDARLLCSDHVDLLEGRPCCLAYLRILVVEALHQGRHCLLGHDPHLAQRVAAFG